jgi:hypothetical protein
MPADVTLKIWQGLFASASAALGFVEEDGQGAEQAEHAS